MSRQRLGSDYVQSLDRGLQVLRAFSRERPSLTLSEVAGLTGLTRATSRRLLLTLEHLGYVRADEREFSLTPQVLDLGYAYLSSLQVGDIVEPYLEALVATVQESCSVAVLDGTEIVYVARVPTQRIMTIALTIGTRLPAHVTSMGRVLLGGLSDGDALALIARCDLRRRTNRTLTDPHAILEQVVEGRERGWCLVDQELEEGVRSAAAPLRDKSGGVIAAMNVSGHAGRVTLGQMKSQFLPALLAATDDVNDRLSRL